MLRSAAPQRAPVPACPCQRRAGSRSRTRTHVSVAAAAASAAPPLRTLYPAAGAPRTAGVLAVQAPHVLHYEEYGNAGAPLLHGQGTNAAHIADAILWSWFLIATRVPASHALRLRFAHAGGVPALVVHGGPGAACWPNHARFFDPARAWRSRCVRAAFNAKRVLTAAAARNARTPSLGCAQTTASCCSTSAAAAAPRRWAAWMATQRTHWQAPALTRLRCTHTRTHRIALASHTTHAC
jgi:hypothetical protein